MAVPKKKKSSARRDMRRAHHDKMTAPSLTTCPECGDVALRHHVCPSCGTYNGRKVTEGEED